MADQICTTLYESGPKDRFKIKKKNNRTTFIFLFYRNNINENKMHEGF